LPPTTSIHKIGFRLYLWERNAAVQPNTDNPISRYRQHNDRKTPISIGLEEVFIITSEFLFIIVWNVLTRLNLGGKELELPDDPQVAWVTRLFLLHRSPPNENRCGIQPWIFVVRRNYDDFPNSRVSFNPSVVAEISEGMNAVRDNRKIPW